MKIIKFVITVVISSFVLPMYAEAATVTFGNPSTVAYNSTVTVTSNKNSYVPGETIILNWSIQPGYQGSQYFYYLSATLQGVLTVFNPGTTLQSGNGISGVNTLTAPATNGSYTISFNERLNTGFSGNWPNSGSMTFSVAPPAPCPLPWGGSISNSASVTAYQSSVVVLPAACSSQVRTCTNGVLSGTYSNQSCNVTAPDLTAGPVTPIAATAGVPVTFSSTISNAISATAGTGSSFSNFFQASSTTSIVDMPASTMPALGIGASSVATSSYIFSSPGTYFVRACADKSSSINSGTISESNDGNNCGVWATVTVTAPDLTAGPVTPVTATTGVPVTFSSTISNAVSVSTPTSFSNFFQVATAIGGGGTITGLAPSIMAALPSGGSAVATAPAYIFPSAGNYSVRACADKSSSLDPDPVAIIESNEGNNCGASWTTVTVTDANAVPTVTTPTVTSITTAGAILGATVASLGSPSSITARGTCWGVSPNPTSNCATQGGLTTGVFTHSRNGMAAGTDYYYRGYATNSTGTGYSPDGTFTTEVIGCALPWGGTIASGGSATAFFVSSVVTPITCASVSETRTCTNGVLSGSYENQSCEVTTSCDLPWGGTIASGASVTAYQVSSVTSPTTCASVSQTRTCTNGVLSGTYMNQNCSSAPVRIRFWQF